MADDLASIVTWQLEYHYVDALNAGGLVPY